MKSSKNKLTFDFEDGKGPVAAKRHRNPDGSEGGWVADTARVEPTCYIGPNARVFGYARMYGYAWVYENARVYEDACVYENARVYGNALVYGNTKIAFDVKINKGYHKDLIIINETSSIIWNINK